MHDGIRQSFQRQSIPGSLRHQQHSAHSCRIYRHWQLYLQQCHMDLSLYSSRSRLRNNILKANISHLRSQPGTTAPVAVTVYHYQAFYNYIRNDLWLAYGIGLLATVICCGLGSSALINNTASNSNDFSTIVRTTRDTKLGASRYGLEATGRDPLPDPFGRIRLRYMGRHAIGEKGGFRSVD